MISFSVWNKKGGSTKTTLSLTYAGYLTSLGKKIAVIDLDPQFGACVCADLARAAGRELPFQVAKSLDDVKGKVDAVIYDHAPGINPGGKIQNIILVPTILDAANYSITLNTVKELQKTNSLYIVIPSRVEVKEKEQKEMLETVFPLPSDENKLLSEMSFFWKSSNVVPYIKKRVSYSRAYGMGMTIFSEKSGLENLITARDEFKGVALYIDMKIEKYIAQLKQKKAEAMASASKAS